MNGLPSIHGKIQPRLKLRDIQTGTSKSIFPQIMLSFKINISFMNKGRFFLQIPSQCVYIFHSGHVKVQGQ